MAFHGGRFLFAAIVVVAGGLSEISAVHSQEPLPDYRRPGFGPRGIGTPDWVFVPDMRTVFQRSRPDYDSLGIHLGSFYVDSQLGIGMGYDDNVFADDDQKVSDAVGTLSPAVRVRSDWSNHLLGFQANGNIQRYLDETSENRETGGATVFGRLDITSRDTLFASAGFRHEVEGREDPENQGGGLSPFNRSTQVLGYTHQFSTLNWRVNFRHHRLEFDNNADDDRDRDEYGVGSRLTYALSPRVTPFVEAGVRFSEFDENVGLDRDSQSVAIAVGSRILITEVLLGELSVGAQHTDFDDPTLDSSLTPALRGELIWNITPLTSIIMEAFRLESASAQAGTAGRVDTGIGLRLEHELLQNLLVSGTVNYENEDFLDTNRNDNRFRVAIGGEFMLNRNLSFGAGYQFENRESNAAGFDFMRNSVFLSTRLQY
jgi:hypothetical protein